MIAKLLTHKGVKMLCVPALMLGTGVATQTNHKRISHAVHVVKHKINRIAHKRVFDEVAPVSVAEPDIRIVEVPSICAPIIPSPIAEHIGITGGGGGSGGAGGGVGSFFPPVSGGGGEPSITPAVPETKTWGMMAIGFFAVGIAFRNRRRMVMDAPYEDES